ncbi:iron complex outermembrane receptor protein [Rhodopseudomonas thermotolerans]|uniref:Iron complex outermembrane recepter protein n=3 Tax=Nitrobacteraceae TaxID=41294 RepID=A0A336JRZ0_9BRAD|nr:iron complex outermembrane receptor protein [Rhodopseudomonas pentothenatexigens]REG03924.1 iron complex outermembrane receptor protein [Rhodopseudomonas thermotolerans]SSW90404.1 iron complex outermembrane recepter protein [Rhodopseudomonas pentothenatexigens]
MRIDHTDRTRLLAGVATTVLSAVLVGTGASESRAQHANPHELPSISVDQPRQRAKPAQAARSQSAPQRSTRTVRRRSAEPPSPPQPVTAAPNSATQTIGTLPAAFPGGQVAQGARIGMLGNRNFMDTPFAATAYTSQMIRDRGAQTVADVLDADPSVRSTHSSGGLLDSFYIRGFPIGEGNFGEIAFDGIFGIAPTYQVFTDYAERIEVLKGPTAFLYGLSPNSGVGGTINIVPKRAGDTDLTRLTTDFATKAQGGASVDISRRFGDHKEFGIRFNGSAHGGQPPVDNLQQSNFVGSLALDYRGERLRATLDFIGQRENLDAPQRPFYPSSGNFAVPAAPNGARNVQAPWEWSKSEDKSVLGKVEYDLTDNVTWFGAVGGGNSRVHRLFGLPTLLNSSGDVSIRTENALFDVGRMTAETGVRSRFETGAISHTMTLQSSYLNQTLDRGSVAGTTQLSNIYNPAYRPELSVADPTLIGRASENTLSGVALSDTLSMLNERVQLTVGGRFQQIDSKNYNFTTGARTSSSDESAVTPLVGLVIRPWSMMSIYANYAEGLSIGETAPANAVNAGETLAPYKTKQYEVGTKFDLGRIGLTLSAFQIERPFGQLESNGTNLVFARGGEQRNRGLELGVFGEVTQTVRVLGGVTLIDGELTKTNSAATLGNRPVGVPTVQTNLGAEWDTPFATGLTLSATAIHTGQQYVNAANTQMIPAWTRLDLGARYRTTINARPVTFRAAVQNVFNEDYWSGVASYGTIAQGRPLTFRFSMTTDF